MRTVPYSQLLDEAVTVKRMLIANVSFEPARTIPEISALKKEDKAMLGALSMRNENALVTTPRPHATYRKRQGFSVTQGSTDLESRRQLPFDQIVKVVLEFTELAFERSHSVFT